MLGLTENPPKFVKKYADLSSQIENAVSAYAGDVRAGKFTGAEHSYTRPAPMTDTTNKKKNEVL